MPHPLNPRAALLAAGLLVGLLGSAAHAGVSVSPLKRELSIKPGETLKFTLTVANNKRDDTDVAQSVRIEVVDVAVSDDGGLSFPVAGSQKNSASSWIKLGATDLTLEPGKAQSLECVIRAPYVTSGEYYSAILVTLVSPGRSKEGVSVTYRLASGVFVTVEGRVRPKQAKVVQCDLVWPPSAETPSGTAGAGADDPPVARPRPKISVVLQNTGEARFDAQGKVSIVDENGRTVLAAPLTSKRPCVFGGDRRLFEAPVDRPLRAGRYEAKVEMDYQSSWGKAHYRMPLNITSEQAAMLDVPLAVQDTAPSLVQIGPEKLAVSAPAGAFRTLKLTLKNKSDRAVRCAAAVTPDVDGGDAGRGSSDDVSWVTVGPEEQSLPGGGQKTFAVVVRVPADAAAGPHACAVTIRTDDGVAESITRVPLAMTVSGGE
jgi:hypothetical protein